MRESLRWLPSMEYDNFQIILQILEFFSNKIEKNLKFKINLRLKKTSKYSHGRNRSFILTFFVLKENLKNYFNHLTQWFYLFYWLWNHYQLPTANFTVQYHTIECLIWNNLNTKHFLMCIICVLTLKIINKCRIFKSHNFFSVSYLLNYVELLTFNRFYMRVQRIFRAIKSEKF